MGWYPRTEYRHDAVNHPLFLPHDDTMYAEPQTYRTINLIRHDPFGVPYSDHKFLLTRNLTSEEKTRIVELRNKARAKNQPVDEVATQIIEHLQEIQAISCRIIDDIELCME